ncbi:MAG: hypothetical protein AAF889_14705, partial [Cyanobacteria bacterium P01_D01_bin.73]
VSSNKACILMKLSKSHPELLTESLEAIRQISSELNLSNLLSKWDENTLELESLSEVREIAIAIRDPYYRAEALAGFTDRTSWEAIAEDHNENLLRLLSTRERKHLIELLPKLHPTLLELGGQPAVDAALDAMRDACNQWP